MATAPKRYDSGLPTGLDVNAFLAWVKDKPGRYELDDGIVCAMSPERAGHARTKLAVHLALVNAITASHCNCRVLPDGVAVHVSDTKWYEPDALVYCGPEAGDDDLNIVNPVIVVEVVSPSTERLDASEKLIGCFGVESVQHYVIVSRERASVVHHQRQPDGTILTRIVANGTLKLDPPGIEIDVARFFQ